MKRHLTYIIIGLLAVCSSMPTNAQTLSEEAEISLLTCAPGVPLYFHYGHSAIRVRDNACTDPMGNTIAIDWTFNYGIFDFNTEHFYLKFLRGETDYMLGLEYTDGFLLGAAYDDRHVSFQPLLLTQEEKQKILDALIENHMPQNRFYRYNFVYDNCATRPWRIIRRSTGIGEAEGMADCSWRQACDYYSGKYSWGKYGINLLFGYEADRQMTREESLFLPENLMNYVSEQGLTDNEDIRPFVPRNGTFMTSPELMTIILLLLLAGLTAWDWAKKRYATWVADIMIAVAFLILGCIITFMYFFSCHPFVGSNMLVLLLNPAWLVVLVLLCRQSWRGWLINHATWMLGYATIAVAIMLFLGQTLHPILSIIFLLPLRWYLIDKRISKKN